MRSQKKKNLILIFIILFVVVLGGFLYYQFIEQKGTNQKFRTVKVERGEISSIVTATGTINPVITVLVGSQVSGTIKALYADFNSQVKEGQVIAQIDPAIFEAQVEQAKANVATALANLSNAQANLQNTQANLVKAEVAVLDTKRTLDRNATACMKRRSLPRLQWTRPRRIMIRQWPRERCQGPGGICKVSDGIFKGSGGAG